MEKFLIITEEDLTQIVRSAIKDAIVELLPSRPRDDPGTPDKLRTVKECCEELRICRGTFFSLLKSGDLKSVKIGRRRFISSSEIKQFLKPKKL